VTIVAFCPFRGLLDKVSARPAARPLLSHINPGQQFQATVEGRDVLMVERVYGGPVCATVIEEMAYLGVRHVIGCGYSGSLRAEIRPGEIVLATSGLASDGTTHEYTDAEEVRPSGAMLEAYAKLGASSRERVRAARVWTTDAIYREYPSKVAAWAERGADVVNMDTSPLYAVSEAVGIEAIYFSVISDYVGAEEWEEDFSEVGDAVDALHALVLTLIGAL
jgi:uridine phosphorylase